MFYLFKHYWQGETQKKSVYLPAARTGIMEFFTNITQIRNRLFNEVMSILSGPEFDRPTSSPRELKEFMRLGKLPTFMNEFYDLLLDAQSQGIATEVKDLFLRLFGGHVDLVNERGVPSLTFQDDSGVTVNIENAGSGVLASLPVLLGLHYVDDGGLLIVEEPEAHIEPDRQGNLLESLLEVSKARKINLLFTTHNESIVQNLLSMVNQKKLKLSELGLYEFITEKDKFTTIQKIDVEKQGSAELPIFQKATDHLIEKFSK